MARDVCLSMLSDGEIKKVELEQKAKILHEDITKHRIAQELELLQKLTDNANEKGRRYQVYRYIAQSQFLKTPSYLSSQLENNIPCVIPEEVELESLDTNDNQVQQCSDETTSMKQDIPRVTPEKVQLEPPAEDETDGNKTHEYANGTTPAEDGAPCSGS